MMEAGRVPCVRDNCDLSNIGWADDGLSSSAASWSALLGFEMKEYKGAELIQEAKEIRGFL